MYKIFIVLGLAFSFNIAQASTDLSCIYQERYKERVDLDEGRVLFVEPGLYTEMMNHKVECHSLAYSSYNNPALCSRTAENTCKYLGMKEGVSWDIILSPSGSRYMTFTKGYDSPRFFHTIEDMFYISNIVCK